MAASASGRRYLAVWLPFLPSERLRRLWSRNPSPSAAPAEAPLVLVERIAGAMRLAAVDPMARELGLVPGQKLADARACVPQLAAIDHDPVADQNLLERLADAADRYTPLVALNAPDGLTLDVTGCAHLFGGEAALCRDLLERMRGAGFTARAALAGTPEAAAALARHGRPGIVPPGGEAEAVARLPVGALGIDASTALALTRAGLKTIGDLASRPSDLLVARFGAGLATRLRRVCGHEDARLTPRRAVAACMVERRFAEPVARREDLTGALSLVLGKAAASLEQRGEGGRLFEASFFRTDGVVRRIAVETGEATRDTAAVSRLFTERMHLLDDPTDPGFGFDLLRLAVPRTEVLAARQVLIDGRGEAERETTALVDHLVARFGRSNVLRFLDRPSHIPERAEVMVPAIAVGGGSYRSAGPAAARPLARPLQLFDPPQPIETLAEVPDGPPASFHWRRTTFQIIRAEGPERIAGEWWRDGEDMLTRDYYGLEDREGRRFWVFRQGLYGRETASPRWFIHGLFA
ncbi:DNA polymerase Y family protein [Phreatobacter sp.]|uniref:Y-family DNA polymerase n=1 Tax=Phreatobacter sp. TaxID=1966341 RepID=UPI0022BCE4D5|nr:DNA polymerase Y family protein [Phreatobacter sp.]MCZ8317078.1 DNA polymerase Y family protein [Phreatobacter sp.]